MLAITGNRRGNIPLFHVTKSAWKRESGIVGDRYYKDEKKSKGQITFFDYDVFLDLKNHLNLRMPTVIDAAKCSDPRDRSELPDRPHVYDR